MRKLSIRIPDDVLAAYDAAEGTRSALMRRVLTDAIVDGAVEVPPDLRKLAEREATVDRGRLNRKAATFKQRCWDYFSDRWTDGAVTPDDADRLAESWSAEAALYTEEDAAFVDVVTEWFREHYHPDPTRRPEWPDAGVFVEEAGAYEPEVSEGVREAMVAAQEQGLDRGEAVRQVSRDHSTATAFEAAEEVF